MRVSAVDGLYNSVFSGATTANSNPDLRTQLINRCRPKCRSTNTVGVQVNGYATLMTVDQWATTILKSARRLIPMGQDEPIGLTRLGIA